MNATEQVQIMREALRTALIEQATTQLARYPHYAGYHDDWIVVTATREVTFKGSSVLHAGEHYLAAPAGHMELGMHPGWTVYDHHTGHHVSCPPQHLRRA